MKTNIVYNANCFNILKDIDNESIDCIITDPPYGYLDHRLDVDFDYNKFFKESYRILKKNSFICFFGRGERYYKWINKCIELGFKFKESICWDKGNGSTPTLNMLRQHEDAVIFVKGKKNLNKVYIDKIEYDLNSNEIQRLVNDIKRLTTKLKSINTLEEWEEFKRGSYKTNSPTKHCITTKITTTKDRAFSTLQTYSKGKLLTDIIRVNREHYNFKHPTQKPIELMNILIKLLSNKKELVLDPFAGSGSTGISCIRNNRNYIMIELLNDYYNIIMNRIKKEKLDLFRNED